MKDLFRSVCMAFSMFSRLPAPRVEWKRENMRHMLGALPLVGAVLGLFYYLYFLAARALGFGALLFGAGLTAVGVLYTGGIHMDGFMDTCDALACHGSIEKRHEILKDPRSGAFAVLYGALYLIVLTALWAETDRAAFLPVCFIPVFSRLASALAGLLFPVYGAGTLKTFRDSSGKRAIILPAVLLMLAEAGLLVLAPVYAGLFSLGTAVCLFVVYRMSQKKFGGMSGDLSGFLLSLTELVLLLLSVLFQKLIQTGVIL